MQNDRSGKIGGNSGNKVNNDLARQESYDDIPENMYRPEKGEYEGWIHREKLAKIESEELQAAGINLAKARSRSIDALGNRIRDNSKDRLGSGSYQKDDKSQRISPPISQEEEERAHWDFRTPEEITADQAASQMYATPVLRKSGSKIPILTSSPAPIPSERYERETPMPRKRTLSGSLTPEDPLLVTKTRSNGMDVGQDESPVKSRSKSITLSRPGTSSGLKNVPTSRKASAPTKVLQSTTGRPGTRGNDTDRPRTAVNRPEGDPPWLATMYKPDPSLPPDQQLIPTLAKKQMQEQWAINGQIPNVYDRNFNSLAVHEDDMSKRSSHIDQDEPQMVQKEQYKDSHPLEHLPSDKSTSSPVKSPMIGNSAGTGGYSTMPKVVSPPISMVMSPNLNSPPSVRASKSSSSGPTQGMRNSQTPIAGASDAPASSSTRVQNPRMPRPTEEQDKKIQKKGCCCIVM